MYIYIYTYTHHPRTHAPASLRWEQLQEWTADEKVHIGGRKMVVLDTQHHLGSTFSCICGAQPSSPRVFWLSVITTRGKLVATICVAGSAPFTIMKVCTTCQTHTNTPCTWHKPLSDFRPSAHTCKMCECVHPKKFKYKLDIHTDTDSRWKAAYASSSSSRELCLSLSLSFSPFLSLSSDGRSKSPGGHRVKPRHTTMRMICM